MDPDIRSLQPGVCPRCGMKLVAGIPDSIEYLMSIDAKPRGFRAGQDVRLAFTIKDPRTGAIVKEFQEVHEKLFHMFIVSQDLRYFLHNHPVLGADGIFRYNAKLPKPGLYRVLGDFYPAHGTPQLAVKSLIVPGASLALKQPSLVADLSEKQSANMKVALTMEPAHPIAGMKTLLFFKVDPADGLQKYLGAWGHMLAASSDLIDLIHNHPFIADGGPNLQFNMIFPRPGIYRVWVQFQRDGVVNTAQFDVPVEELK